MNGDEFELEVIRQRLEIARYQLFFDWERGTFQDDTICPDCANLAALKKGCHRCGGVGWLTLVNITPDPAYL